MKKSTAKIEIGLRELLAKTQPGNEKLINRAFILNKLESLIKTLLLSTRRRLSNKLNPNPGGPIEQAFEKFNKELEGIFK